MLHLSARFTDLLVLAPVPIVPLFATLDRGKLAKIAKTYRFAFDERKQIGRDEQLARHVIERSTLRSRSSLGEDERALLDAALRRGGAIPLTSDAALAGLEARALLLPHGGALVVPLAVYLDLEPFPGESIRARRLLLRGLGKVRLRQILARRLGAPPSPPLLLRLESIYGDLADDAGVSRAITTLEPLEAEVFRALRALGGEARAHEIEATSPSALAATLVSLEQKGIAFVGEQGGITVPDEVMRIAHQMDGAPARPEGDEDELPLRAVYAESPVGATILLAMEARRDSLREDVGIPRSFVARLARSLGAIEARVHFLACLARTLGLFRTREPADIEGTLEELHGRLYATWREGLAWDEAELLRDPLRKKGQDANRTPTYLARDLVIDALLAKGSSWSSVAMLSSAIAEDPRYPVLEARFEALAARNPHVSSLSVTLTAIIEESMWSLGLLDRSEDGAYRLSRDGQRVVRAEPPRAAREVAHFEGTTLVLGAKLPLHAALELGLYGTAGTMAGELSVRFDAASLRAALLSGFTLSRLERSLSRIGTTKPPEIEELLALFSRPLGTAKKVECGAFLSVENEAVREALLALPNAANLFLADSPPTGLLVRASVSPALLEAALRAARVSAS